MSYLLDPKYFKIVVAGDGGVGKTTLLHRYVNGEFLEETSMTLGLDIFNKEVEISGKSYKVLFWDVGVKSNLDNFTRLLSRVLWVQF